MVYMLVLTNHAATKRPDDKKSIVTPNLVYSVVVKNN